MLNVACSRLLSSPPPMMDEPRPDSFKARYSGAALLPTIMSLSSPRASSSTGSSCGGGRRRVGVGAKPKQSRRGCALPSRKLWLPKALTGQRVWLLTEPQIVVERMQHVLYYSYVYV